MPVARTAAEIFAKGSYKGVFTIASGGRRAAAADGTCVKRGSSQRLSQLQDRLPGPPTHDLKAGLHHLSHREAYGATWSSLGSSLATSTFGRPAQFGPTLGNWSQVLAYCCSRGLLFTSVVHEAHCCSVVTVNNKNIVHKLTFDNSSLCMYMQMYVLYVYILLRAIARLVSLTFRHSYTFTCRQ